MKPNRSNSRQDANDLLLLAIQLLNDLRHDPYLDSRLHDRLDDALECVSNAFRPQSGFAQTPRISPNEIVQRLDQLIISNERLFSRLAGGDELDLVTSEHSAIPHVKARPGQIEHIIAGLLAAFIETKQGNAQPALHFTSLVLSESDARHLSLVPGEFAAILVRNRSKHGFSTIGTGAEYDLVYDRQQATKLARGLECTFDALTDLKGRLAVDTKDPKGTDFIAYLPSVSAPSSSKVSFEQRDALILVVDDDAMVRRYTRRALETAGYRVLEAASSADALEVVRNQRRRVDALITDLVLPDMHGGKLAQAVESELGETPTIYVSGYDDRAIRHHRLIGPSANLLHKPYTRRSLLKLLNALV